MAETKQLIKIAREHQTPSFIFDVKILKDRISKIQKDLGEKTHICYAMKANPFLLHVLKDTDILFEVCSPGEFAICKRTGINMQHIVLSGVNKQEKEVMDAIKSGVDCLTIESVRHMEIIQKVCKELNSKVKVMFRLTSGNQFGMGEETVEECVKVCSQDANLTLLGLQLYSGTQKKTLRKIKKELQMLISFTEELNQKYGLQMKHIEYGPGFPVEYFEDDSFAVLHEEYEETCSLIKEVSESYELTLEMGRFIAATCGYYLTSIVDIKTNKEQNYCLIDGGINHINYYGQMMAMKKPVFQHIGQDVDQKEDTKSYIVCGSLCTTADLIMKDVELTNLQIGDLMIFENIGAYSITEGIYLFLSRTMPKVMLLEESGEVTVVRDFYETNELNY